MRPIRIIAIALVSALGLAAQSQAATVFEDNFDTNTLALNSTPTTWTTLSGVVDVIGMNGAALFDYLPGNGVYIDMDGSRAMEGAIQSQTISLAPGQYELSYDLAGSQRHDGNNSVAVSVSGGLLGPTTRTLADSVGFTTFTEMFTVSAATTAEIVFRAVTGVSDNFGLLLDRVKLTAVPLPAAVWLMLSGIAGLGAFARRRRANAAG